MEFENLKALCHLESALWANLDRVAQTNLEGLGAVSLLDLSEERRVDRFSALLLQRAQKDGTRSAALGVAKPFFRLTIEERFLLSALYYGHWGYARIGQLLDMNAEDVERLAWSARLQLNPTKEHPIGGGRGPSCPEYDSARPWTQRFLDDELQSRERLFLQNHLMACDACRAALHRCRKLHYAVAGELPQAENEAARIKRAERVVAQASGVRNPGRRGFAESLVIFLGRPEIQRAAWIATALLFFVWWKL